MKTLNIIKAIISDSKVIFKMSSNNTNNNINNKTTNKMETRNISLTLEEAREWYNSNIILRDIALKVFTKEELECSFKNIKSFKDACHALNISYDTSSHIAAEIAVISKASAAMFKLNIIRTALHLGQDLTLTTTSENSRICIPYNPFISNSSKCYKEELNSGKMVIIGSIKSKGKTYSVLNGKAIDSYTKGLGNYLFRDGIGFACADFAFLGCANKEIAEHFGKYFGMLITEAKYGDLPDFEIVTGKYKI